MAKRNLFTFIIYLESITGRLVFTLQPTNLLTIQWGHFFIAMISVACMTMSCHCTGNTTYAALHRQLGLHDFSCIPTYRPGAVTTPQLLQHICITCVLNTELQRPEGTPYSEIRMVCESVCTITLHATASNTVNCETVSGNSNINRLIMF